MSEQNFLSALPKIGRLHSGQVFSASIINVTKEWLNITDLDQEYDLYNLFYEGSY